MPTPSRMPRYDVRNDGTGPYAIFYCDQCNREFRSQPNLGSTVASGLGQDFTGGLLRKIPLFGDAIANNMERNDPRYTYDLTSQQLAEHWNQVKHNFRECPTCNQIVCLSDFDDQAGYCNQDSPRASQIAEARGQQAGAALKGIANAFGLGAAFEQAGRAAQQAINQTAHCPKCNTLANPGTKFCPECGTTMIQPAPAAPANCPKCGAETHGAKFCPNCGTKQEAAPAAPANCPQCGAPANGAKFCPNCGSKIQ